MKLPHEMIEWLNYKIRIKIIFVEHLEKTKQQNMTRFLEQVQEACDEGV